MLFSGRSGSPECLVQWGENGEGWKEGGQRVTDVRESHAASADVKDLWGRAPEEGFYPVPLQPPGPSFQSWSQPRQLGG